MHRLLAAVCCAALAIGCGEKISLPGEVHNDDDGRLTDTTFVPILPHWTSADGIPFNYPFGVDIGYDRTIYVSDTRNDRIVRLTGDGAFIESFPMSRPHGVAQDRAFTLMAVNEGNSVWIRRQGEAEFAKFATADSTFRCLLQPGGGEICWWDVPHFTSITATRLAKSIFYVTGAGRVQSVLGDPHQPNPALYPSIDSGTAYGSLYSPIDIEFSTVRDQHRLIVSQFGRSNGVQYFAIPSLLPAISDPQRDAFRTTLDDVKYVAADERGNVFVLHRANGRVMMFDKDGNFILSFGRDGTDPLSLQDPTSIAVLDDIVLIADAKNNRISRYQLTAIPQN